MPEKTPLIENPPPYAGLGRRFMALVADFLILSAIFFPVTRVVKGVWVMSSGDHLWGYGWVVTDPLCISFLIVIVAYFVLLEGLFGATIGKRLLGLQVVQVSGGNPGVMRSLSRNVLRIIDSLPAFNILGVILIERSPEKARFGDRLAGTRVIIRPRGKSL
jgi:uncharacterized RDD family membrane protein YckC